ncbi:ethanolamine utilization protein EutN [Photobacterium profundum]|uniref:Putative detox protein in ethanolamine utilization n=1 Tax=Photobacterium profundum 3TCK TaxID=314280 RepID=Q1YX48_9GAMM|nr:EutN/CcmL family microcompartment protein [Photobacterium profundum]EAS40834.1 putative detox protein in ethanolamine utilization [Photobacterium profundum 3TCK]PSV62388.1 ethanolamine utilization protein EutN [Photobacterium profundum]
MRVARVIGHVIATVRSQHMRMDKLCLVEFVDKNGGTSGDIHIAMDQLGAGEGEWVMVVSGSSARAAYGSVENDSPVDLCVVGIIDEVTAASKQLYSKRG